MCAVRFLASLAAAEKRAVFSGSARVPASMLVFLAFITDGVDVLAGGLIGTAALITVEEKGRFGMSAYRIILAEIDAGFLESSSAWTREVYVVHLWWREPVISQSIATGAILCRLYESRLGKYTSSTHNYSSIARADQWE